MKSNAFKKHYRLPLLKSTLKTGLLSGCIVFLYIHLDFASTWEALSQYSPIKSIVLTLWFLASFLFLGARLYVIAHGQIRLKDSISAVFLGFFANSILPARVGESVKGLYLKYVSKRLISQILTFVIWERFFDLNMLLIMVVLLSAIGDSSEYLLPIFALALVCWGVLLLVNIRYRDNDIKINQIRPPWLRKIVRHFSGKPDKSTICKLIAINIVVWAQFILEMFIAMYWVAGINLPLTSAMNVFIISSLAFAIPASPGGIGLYDAAIVFSMGIYGIPAADAMAFAILMRTIQYVPTLLIGFTMIIVGGTKLREIIHPLSTQKIVSSL
ncbi:MAG: UPF0104 family protein [Desulfobacteraceae bacterium]|nr:MAG: UPF0104 family protein [Desulfobacteraceae bacterium]